jgi:hypothetical protein
MSGRADANGDRDVTTEELRDYLAMRVPQIAAELGRAQNPQYFPARDAEVYALARVQ